jgi:putative SOS response-associated peptidase YedK
VQARYNIAPGTQITSVCAAPEDSLIFGFSRWGFRLPWVKEDAPTPINIRSEKAARETLTSDPRLLVGVA